MSTTTSIQPSGHVPTVKILRPDEPFASIDLDVDVRLLELDPEQLRLLSGVLWQAADQLDAAIETAAAARKADAACARGAHGICDGTHSKVGAA